MQYDAIDGSRILVIIDSFIQISSSLYAMYAQAKFYRYNNSYENEKLNGNYITRTVVTN